MFLKTLPQGKKNWLSYWIFSNTKPPCLHFLRLNTYGQGFRVFRSSDQSLSFHLLSAIDIIICRPLIGWMKTSSYQFYNRGETVDVSFIWSLSIRRSSSQMVFTRKHLCWGHFLINLHVIRSRILLERDSNTGAFLWILQNF